MSTTTQFSIADLKLIIDCERKMELGEIPYVYVEGAQGKQAMIPEIMSLLGLSVGQRVSSLVWIEILKINIQYITEKIDKEKVDRLVEEELPRDPGVTR